jgi:hypothetical protein
MEDNDMPETKTDTRPVYIGWAAHTAYRELQEQARKIRLELQYRGFVPPEMISKLIELELVVEDLTRPIVG